MLDAPTSNDLLLLAQQSTGRRQKMLFSLLKIQMLAENAGNLTQEQKDTLGQVIGELEELIPAKGSPTQA